MNPDELVPPSSPCCGILSLSLLVHVAVLEIKISKCAIVKYVPSYYATTTYVSSYYFCIYLLMLLLICVLILYYYY